MAQGYGGIMSLTGDADGPPMKVGVGIADVMCGMYATIGILAALRHRDATGEGQHIDLSLVDSQMAWLINEGTNFLASGKEPVRRGNAHPNIVPYDVFATKDGHVILAVGNDAQFQKFCKAMGRDDLGADSRFATNPDRITNRDALTEVISEILGAMTTAYIIEVLQKVHVTCGPIHTVGKALNTDQAKARGTVMRVDHPGTTAGHVDLLGNPLKFSKTPVTVRRAPPRFGQDTENLSDILDAHRKQSKPHE
jgi:formyl-CoA transferase